MTMAPLTLLSFKPSSMTDGSQEKVWAGNFSDIAERAELMQFTGLLDANGREIYEGDIVRSGSSREMYEVQWSDEGPGWDPFLSSMIYGGDEPLLGRDVTVIGNRYENPALLDALE